MKQTAVQWLVEQLENHNGVTKKGFENVIQKALAIEKEQMGALYAMWLVNRKTMELYDFEEYYNETFKSE